MNNIISLLQKEIKLLEEDPSKDGELDDLYHALSLLYYFKQKETII